MDINQTSTKPEVEFQVGAVRVRVWPDATNPRDYNKHIVTIERTSTGRSGVYECTGVLNVSQITQAILALKKVHDYLERRRAAPEGAGELHSAAHQLPERTP